MPTIIETNSKIQDITASVVQLSMDGDVVMSSGNAKFANSKKEAKEILGSAEKISATEFLIADSINRRAIIVKVDIANLKSEVTWEYKSDRYIVDAHRAYVEQIAISLNDDSVSPADLNIPQNKTVIWENNSNSPVSVYSGTTTYDDFQLNPDLSVYGTIFQSPVLQPGERYSHKFVSIDSFNWFTYPDILTGTITTARNQLFSQDKIVILESDGLASPFTSRVIKVDTWGNVIWSFGEGYLVKPRDARPLLNGGVIIST